jgi:Protein of unknown function (DUF1353)
VVTIVAADVPVRPGLSRFETELELNYLDGRTWRLLQTFNYSSVVLERVVVIAAGFLTDFASIPRVLWSVWPPTGPYGKAAVVHDWLYRTPGIATRADADRALAEAMAVLHVGWFTRQIIYRGVRVGGASAYHGGITKREHPER